MQKHTPEKNSQTKSQRLPSQNGSKIQPLHQIKLENYTQFTATQNSQTNTTTVSYGYCGDDYVSESWGRTAVDTTAGLFAIALLLIAVALFYAVGRNEGIFKF